MGRAQWVLAQKKLSKSISLLTISLSRRLDEDLDEEPEVDADGEEQDDDFVDLSSTMDSRPRQMCSIHHLQL
jgi:hypothetical protein